MNRRLLLKSTIGGAALAGVTALGRYAVRSPPASERLASIDQLAIEIYESLPEIAKT